MAESTMLEVREFDPQRVRPLPNQPHKQFHGIRKLARSMATVGQTTTGIVSLVEGDPDIDAQLIDGERRLRACKLANLRFRAEIRRDATSDEARFRISFAANFQKQDHDCMEIATSIQRLFDEGMKIEEIGDLCGKSVGWVIQHRSLLRLHPDVQKLLVAEKQDEDDDVVPEREPEPEEGSGIGGYDQPSTKVQQKLTLSMALILASVPPEQQVKLASKITNEKMSMAAARRLVYKEVRETGCSTRRKRGGGEHLASLYSLIKQANDRFGFFMDMLGHDLNEMIDTQEDEGKLELAELLHDLVEQISGLEDAVRGRISTRANMARAKKIPA